MNIRCVCGAWAAPATGAILSRLYPGATFCTGCGRRQLHCACARPALDAGDGPAASRSVADLRGRTQLKEAA